MAAPPRVWTAARAKVEEEGCCRVCGRADVKLEAAHIMGRSHDSLEVCPSCGGEGFIIGPGTVCGECKGHQTVILVNPLDVVPLCGPSSNQQSCHARYDHRKLDLLPYLWHDEQVRAVEQAGTPGTRTGIVLAFLRLTGQREAEVRTPVAQPSDVPW